MRLERQGGLCPGPRNQESKAGGRERPAPLGHEQEIRVRRRLPLEPTQRPELVTLERMDRWRATLHAPDMQARLIEVDLAPTEIADLGRPQATPVRDQDHDGVPMAVPVALGRGDQLIDLGWRQVFALPQFGILRPPWCARANCTVFDGW